MAEVRCPLCGKPNPDELEVCQHCGARLKPLRIDPQTERSPESEDRSDFQAGGSTEGDLPDWLDLSQEGPEASASADSSTEPSLDWLSGLREQSPSQELPEESDEPAAFQDLDYDKPSETGEEIPPWLMELRSQAVDFPDEQSGGSGSSEPLEQGTGWDVDWLTQESEKGRDEGQEAVLPTWASETPEREAADEALDWPPRSGAEQPTDEEVPEDHESDQTDLSGEGVLGLTKSSPRTSGSRLLGRLVADESQREWFTPEDGMTEPGDVLETAEEADFAPGGEFPEDETLLSSMEGQAGLAEQVEEIPAAERPIPPSSSDQETYPEAGELSEQDLDWLSELEAAYSESEDRGTPAGESGPDPWLESLEAKQPKEVLEEQVGESLPGWLEEMPTTSPGEKESGEEPGLSPAQLPGWLEAMRPVESVDVPIGVPEETKAHIELAGPLAGLKGILPAEPEAAASRRPAAYTMKLQVTDAQQNQAALLEQIVRAEGESRPVPGRPLITSQYVLRIIIAAVLLLAILVPLLPGSPLVGLPALPPLEILAASQLISSLPPGAPVLAAVEYEAGNSGEMDAAFGAVVDHLMIKGAFLALVSTTPTGPLQAEHLVAFTNQMGGHQYSSASLYVNFGFLPGGPVGLRSFASDPRSAVIYTLEGQPAWQSDPLKGITELDQFSLVLVATDDFTKARGWLEQVQPNLKGTPLIFVTSAQTEPLVRPFYDAVPRQVQGLVSGLAGGAYYGTAIGRSGIASLRWSSFSYGMILAAVLILVGGGVNAISALLGADKEMPEGKLAQ